MSNRASNTITKHEQLPRLLGWIGECCAKGLEGGPMSVDVYRPEDERSSPQNGKIHCLFADIQKMAVISMPGKRVAMSQYDVDTVKAFCVIWFANERALDGEPLRKMPKTEIDPMTGERVTIRPSTTTFGKKVMSAFIEWLYALGSTSGVKWSEPSLKAFESYREAQNGA